MSETTMIGRGPMFEPKEHQEYRSIFGRDGAHYNIYEMKGGIKSLHNLFENGEANELNFVLFSTSGVHGTYTTIEDIEHTLRKYPDGIKEGEDYPDDFTSPNLTVLVIHPRLVCMRYGTIDVRLEDIEFLKTLRQSSWNAITHIGADSAQDVREP